MGNPLPRVGIPGSSQTKVQLAEPTRASKVKLNMSKPWVWYFSESNYTRKTKDLPTVSKVISNMQSNGTVFKDYLNFSMNECLDYLMNTHTHISLLEPSLISFSASPFTTFL